MECGDCTLCCSIFPVSWLKKPANTECVHCDVGCKIHETKDAECTDFNCAYAQMEKAHTDLRPDNCGVIFEMLSDNLFYGTLDPKYSTVSQVAHAQIDQFQKHGYSVVVHTFHGNGPLVWLAENHDKEEVHQQLNEILEKKYGNS